MIQKELLKLTFTSMFVAMAIILGLITKYVPGLNLEMPQGGSVFGLPMLPLVLIGMLFGVRYGILGGAIYGLVSVLLDGGVYHWVSFFSDYLIAFGVLGLSGMFKGALADRDRFVVAIFVAAFLRYLSHAFFGSIIFAEFAPEGVNPWFYSFVLYNAPYMLSSTAVTVVIGLILRTRILRLAQDFKLMSF
ncbi:MAG: energy-coupled thiamine transporter ThiT [Acholeplasmataceae bacterium]|nr:energy-coupled thiamine transporter ThiT [Acholeplasmataceae bacterium]